MHIGKRIMILRKQKGLSQEYIGKGIISTTHLSNIETGRYTPSEDILLLICQKLEVPKKYMTDYNLNDPILQKHILEMKKALVIDINKAKELLLKFEDKYIFSLEQEVLFLILKTCYLLKTGNQNGANNILETHLNYYITRESYIKYSSLIQECYLYMAGLKTYIEYNYLSSYHYFKEYLKYINDDLIKASMYYNLSLICKESDQIELAIHHAKQSLDLHLNNHNWTKVGELYNFISVIYWNKNFLIVSTEYLEKARSINEFVKSTILESKILHNKGLIFKKAGNYIDAILHFEESLKYKKENNINPLSTYHSLINCYRLLGNIRQVQNLIFEAKYFITNEFDLNLLKYYEAQMLFENLEEQLHMRKEVIKYFESVKNYKVLRNMNKEVGEIYYKQRKYKNAAFFFKQEIEVQIKLEEVKIYDKA